FQEPFDSLNALFSYKEAYRIPYHSFSFSQKLIHSIKIDASKFPHCFLALIPNAWPKKRPSRPGGKIRNPICAVSYTIKAAEGIVHAIFLLPRRCSRLRGETETDLTAKTRRTLRV